VLNILMPRYTGPYRTQFKIIQGADQVTSDRAGACPGIKVLDPQTIQFNLSAPNAPFLNNMYILRPLPAHLLEGQDPRTAPFNQSPVGTGPFKFKSWKVGGDFVAVANTDYWGGRPYLDQFTHRVIPDASTLVLALETREIDGSLYPDPTQYDNLRAKDFLNVVQQPPGSDIEGWGFNCDVPALAIKEVRQAIAHALDINAFLKIAYPNGLGGVANGPMNPNAWFWDKNVKPPAYDLNLARQLLAKSGQRDISVTLMVNNGNTQRQELATYTQSQLKQIGISATIQQPEWTQVVNTISAGKAQMSIPWAYGTYDPDDLYNYLYSTSPANVYHYKNPQVDRLLTQGRETVDQNRRIEIYDQLQQVIADELPTYWAYYRAFINVIGRNFGGVHPSFLGLFWNLPKIYRIS
jgi:peptide/nickel transport system substrate-binding protein